MGELQTEKDFVSQLKSKDSQFFCTILILKMWLSEGVFYHVFSSACKKTIYLQSFLRLYKKIFFRSCEIWTECQFR